MEKASTRNKNAITGIDVIKENIFFIALKLKSGSKNQDIRPAFQFIVIVLESSIMIIIVIKISGRSVFTPLSYGHLPKREK